MGLCFVGIEGYYGTYINRVIQVNEGILFYGSVFRGDVGQKFFLTILYRMSYDVVRYSLKGLESVGIHFSETLLLGWR